MLLATPYLRWGWWMRGGNGPGAGALPMRLFVAFHGGDPARPSYTAEAPRWLGAELPPFDRVIELVWATTGTAPLPSPAEGAVARHAVRAGSGGLGRWQLESVDLAALYGALWPGDDAGRARIMFIGVRVTTAPSAATAAVAEVMLGR